jgi:hypothetical protein
MFDDWMLSADLSWGLTGHDDRWADLETLIMLRLGRRGETAYAERTQRVSLHELERYRKEAADLFSQARSSRGQDMETFARVLSTQFGFAELADAAAFRPGEKTTVTVTTPVSALPWDLLWLDDNYFAHRVSLAIVVPTPGQRILRERALDSRRDRFLNVIAPSRLNPVDEIQRAEALEEVARQAGLEYLAIRNPDAVELFRALQDRTWRTSYLHFAAHITQDRIQLSDDAVVDGEGLSRHLSQAGTHVVFLNGCDRHLDLGKRDLAAHRSLLSPRSMANWCLGAGANAVIAPRTRVDGPATERAATRIWTAILGGVSVGEAVREYRIGLHKEDPDDLAGYSYVAYGDPRFVRPKPAPAAVPPRPTLSLMPIGAPTVEVRSPYEALFAEPIVREAAAEAGRDQPLKPHHLIAALSRRWSLAFSFYRELGGLYIFMLHQLRRELGFVGAAPALDAGDPRPTLSLETRQIFDELLTHGYVAGALDDVALIAAIVERDAGVLQRGLDTLPSGPREASELVEGARAWVEQGRQVPSVIAAPDGRFDAAFLEGIPRGGASSPLPLTRWRLFVTLLEALPQVLAEWSREGLPPVGPEVALLGPSLYFHQLSEDAQAALMDVAQSSRLSPLAVLGSLAQVDWPFDLLRETDPDAYLRLSAAGVDARSFAHGIEAVRTMAAIEAKRAMRAPREPR